MKFLKLLILLIFISCNSNQIGGNEYTVIEYNDQEWSAILGEAEPTDLTVEEIENIERIIGELVQRTIKLHNNELEKHYAGLPKEKQNEKKFEYFRQYVAGINGKGEKIVWINFFCGPPKNENWKNEIILVADGGNCYFNIKVNLTERKYYEYMVNGIANVENRCTTMAIIHSSFYPNMKIPIFIPLDF